jgi:hypothetical protein
MITNNYSDWLQSVTARKQINDKEALRSLLKEGVGNHLQDVSRPVLERLLQDGYDTVTWDASYSQHSVCRELHNQRWTLSDFLSNLHFDAPMAEKSHPGDTGCFLIVSGPDVSSVTVDYVGNLEPYNG